MWRCSHFWLFSLVCYSALSIYSLYQWTELIMPRAGLFCCARVCMCVWFAVYRSALAQRTVSFSIKPYAGCLCASMKDRRTKVQWIYRSMWNGFIVYGYLRSCMVRSGMMSVHNVAASELYCLSVSDWLTDSMSGSNDYINIYAKCIFVLTAFASPFTQTLYSLRLVMMACRHFPHLLMSSAHFLPSFSVGKFIIHSYLSFGVFTVPLGRHTTYLAQRGTCISFSKRKANVSHKRARLLYWYALLSLARSFDCDPSAGYHMNYWDVQYLIKPKLDRKSKTERYIFDAHCALNTSPEWFIHSVINRDALCRKRKHTRSHLSNEQIEQK